MCKPACVGNYFEKWPSMRNRIKSVEVPFRLRSRNDWGPEQWRKELLNCAGEKWTSKVQIVKCEVQQNTLGLDAVKGQAIFRR